MKAAEIKKRISSGEYDAVFLKVYLSNVINLNPIRNRFLTAIDEFEALFGTDRDIELFSAPGRTEVGGNHTDHNFGCVLAASVNLDVIAVVSKTDNGIIRVKSEGFEMDTVSLDVLTPIEQEKGLSSSLIRGIGAQFSELSYQIGGFDAYTTSNVLKGSGLSSSAAFEVLVGTILSHLYNDATVSAVQIAQIAQYAENVFFGKPCGLMDQMASSVGSFVSIDFADPKHPVIKKVEFDFASCDYSLCIVDTHGNHADLTDDYASIPKEMKSVAALFGKEVLRGITIDELIEKAPIIRGKCSDRAFLRAIHFTQDNERAQQLAAALEQNDFETFKRIIVESGHSSFMYLQNVYTTHNPCEQGLSVALAITEKLLSGKGAYRVHGGGFAGTIQAFVPNELLESYQQTMDRIFGSGSCHVLQIRPVGGMKF